jgi:hypothetical protein
MSIFLKLRPEPLSETAQPRCAEMGRDFLRVNGRHFHPQPLPGFLPIFLPRRPCPPVFIISENDRMFLREELSPRRSPGFEFHAKLELFQKAACITHCVMGLSRQIKYGRTASDADMWLWIRLLSDQQNFHSQECRSHRKVLFHEPPISWRCHFWVGTETNRRACVSGCWIHHDYIVVIWLEMFCDRFESVLLL